MLAKQIADILKTGSMLTNKKTETLMYGLTPVYEND